MLRRRVANDHECLFNALGLVAGEGPKVATKLRKVCADAVCGDPDTFPPAVLGMDNQAYGQWILCPLNWGGETELVVLSKHYQLEVVVVSMHHGTVLVFNEGDPANKGRVYLLYTGQHYDALVGAESENTPEASHVLVFPLGHKPSEALALECAERERKIAEERANQRVRKALKCRGCGAVVDDSEQFQLHCAEVDHDDDFMFECDEIEVVESKSDPVHGLDLSAPNIHTFYNTPNVPLSNLFPCDIEVEGQRYPSVEHFMLASMLAGADPALVQKVRETPSAEAARLLVVEADSLRPDWDDVRENKLHVALEAKFTAHEALRSQLLATGEQTLVMLDNSDMWGGMAAGDGIAKGKNKVGAALEAVRAKLRPSSA